MENKLTLQQENELLRTALENYASGLNDLGKNATNTIQQIALYEISKQCTRCSDIVAESEMRIDRRRKTGSWCKQCDREDSRERRSLKHKPVKAIQISLKKLQVLTAEDTREINFQWKLVWKNLNRLEKQNGQRT